MTEAELSALPVVEIVAPDALLQMWILDTHLEQALRIGKAWGFTYKTLGLIWHKMSPRGLELHRPRPLVSQRRRGLAPVHPRGTEAA